MTDAPITANVVRFPRYKVSRKNTFIVIVGENYNLDGTADIPKLYRVTKITNRRIYVEDEKRTFYNKHSSRFRFFDDYQQAVALLEKLGHEHPIEQAVNGFVEARFTMAAAKAALLKSGWAESDTQGQLL
ncbi:hypothetical protein [Maritalea porphyrae]|uniref:hypothetical protein n=1 Tax=Maritalea porphyrae TaxID=880732 RepID=UPI0022AFAE19|nr:hypothetical protein [Maritalea porphyrae]MCZ4270786.1 hypothetical protein [Maritalea porphyrae]